MAAHRFTKSPLYAYLKSCTTSWVDHDLLLQGFHLRDVQEAVSCGALVLRPEGSTVQEHREWDKQLVVHTVTRDWLVYRINLLHLE